MNETILNLLYGVLNGIAILMILVGLGDAVMTSDSKGLYFFVLCLVLGASLYVKTLKDSHAV